jgi:hypothetical protein
MKVRRETIAGEGRFILTRLNTVEPPRPVPWYDERTSARSEVGFETIEPLKE